MSDVNIAQVASPGQKNLTGNRDALFLEIWSGMVLNFWSLKTVVEGRHTVRELATGKTSLFSVTGSTSSGYHTPGKELTFSNPETNQIPITIRNLCVASCFVDVLEDVQTEYGLSLIHI